MSATALLIRVRVVASWVVRRLQVGEAQQCRALRLAALADAPEMFEATYGEEASQPEEVWEERTRRGAHSDEVATFVAVSDERHIGTATALLPQSAARAQLVAMWVDTPARGLGVGKALVTAVCDW